MKKTIDKLFSVAKKYLALMEELEYAENVWQSILMNADYGTCRNQQQLAEAAEKTRELHHQADAVLWKYLETSEYDMVTLMRVIDEYEAGERSYAKIQKLLNSTNK